MSGANPRNDFSGKVRRLRCVVAPGALVEASAHRTCRPRVAERTPAAKGPLCTPLTPDPTLSLAKFRDAARGRCATRARRNEATSTLPAAGAACVCVQSAVDMPFRAESYCGSSDVACLLTITSRIVTFYPHSYCSSTPVRDERGVK